jgi:branched-chain amino acid transport system permease protein
MIVLRLLVAGVMIGTLYGLVASTLTLMLRASGILSFAHAGFALIGAYVYGGIVCPKDLKSYRPCAAATLRPFPAALVAVTITVLVALVVERLVARPLARATAATKVIATAAVLGLISGLLLQIFGAQPRSVPNEAGRQLLPRGTFEVAGVVVNRAHFTIFLVSICLVALLGALLRRSWFGLAVRAAGQLPDVSRLMGVSPVAVSRFNWALGGLLAGLAGVLIGPITVLNIGTFSFLLAKAVGATLIGGLVSVPLTFVGGIAIGAAEAVVPHFWKTPGSAEVAVAVLVLAMLLVYGKRFALLGYAGSVEEGAAGGPVVTAVASWLVGVREMSGRVPLLIRIMVGLGVLALPLRNSYYASIGVLALYYCLIALSVLVLAGMTGQVSFMQAGFAAIGAFGLATALARGWSLPAALGLAVGACVVIGVLAGVVSLRFRGLEFTIASVALGAVMSEFVVTRSGVRSTITNPEFFGRTLLEAKNLFVVMLAFTAIAMLLVANLRRCGWGRTLATMREMHTRVAHFGVAPMRAEVALLAISAGIAGMAGAFLALTIGTLDPIIFVPLVSVTMVLTAVVGGLRSLWGPVIAGVVFGPGQEIVGRIFSKESANAFPQIASAALAIVLIVGMPSGLASLFAWARSVRDRMPDEGIVRFRGKPLAGFGAITPKVRESRQSAVTYVSVRAGGN